MSSLLLVTAVVSFALGRFYQARPFRLHTTLRKAAKALYWKLRGGVFDLRARIASAIAARVRARTVHVVQ